jgi:hypothetical protein
MTAPKKKEETPAATTTTADPAPATGLPFERVNRIAPLVKLGERSLLPAVGGTSQMKNGLKSFVKRLKQTKRTETVKNISEELKSRSDVRDALTVADAFRNLPAGTGLVVANEADSVNALRAIVDKYQDAFKLFEVALTRPLDPDTDDPKAPRPLEEVADYITRKATGGVMIGIQGVVRSGTYEELVNRNIERPLIGTRPGLDGIQVWCQDVVRSDKDSFKVTQHPLVGATVGKRIATNALHGPGEPMAGNRNTGDGAKGGFDCGVLVQQYTEEQRNQLATWGLNTARDWRMVGEVIGVCNRSLQAGDGIYIFASTVRQRQQIQATFHATAEHNIWHSGRRDDKSLEKTLLAMRRMLDDLKSRGYLVAGDVKINRKEKKIFLIDVLCQPERPIDKILLEYYVNESH